MINKASSITALALLMLLGLGTGLASAASTIANPRLQDSAALIKPGLDTGALALVLIAPSELSASESDMSITLNWADNSLNESGFEIERRADGGAFSQIASTAANVTSYVDNSLTAGTTYTFRVRAYNASQKSSYSNEFTLTKSASALKPDLTIPGDIILSLTPTAPTKLQASDKSGSEVQLKWVDNSYNETGFKIERKGPPHKFFSEIATVKADTTSYEDTGLSNNTTYTYRVRAYNARGNSSYSNEAAILTPTDVVDQVINKTIIYRIGQTTYYLNGAAYIYDVAPLYKRRTFIHTLYSRAPRASITWDAAVQRPLTN